MRVRRLASTVAASALAATGLAGLTATSAFADESFTVTPLHFKVAVGPNDDTECDIVGDLYLPKSATTKKTVPAILTTNGFGGSKNDQAGVGRAFSERGYAVLSYSGLGFGGSDCKITLDDPDFDGKAASQLVSYLGGSNGIAFLDDAHTQPAPPLTVVTRDRKDNAGRKTAHDPRVGMIGGSYGGQVQYAAASVDKRIDTIIPLITWTDLSYSLVPNNTSQTTGVSTSTPGASKSTWALGFSGLGLLNGVQNAPTDPTRVIGCPNFATFVCPSLAYSGATGTADAATTAALRHASLSSYMKKVTIPTLIMQGQSDTLFNLNEGIAAYQGLKKQKTPVKMVWFNGGHSGPNAPGEIDFSNLNTTTQHLAKRVSDWFDHYLMKSTTASTGPEFTYFRNWVAYTGNAKPAYAESTSFPVGTKDTFTLSGNGALTPDAGAVTPGSVQFTTPPAGAPTSTDRFDVVGNPASLPEKDAPGTFAEWSTPTLSKPIDVVGQPVLDLKVSAPTAAITQLADPGKLVLFVKIADVAPDGSIKIIRNLVAPVRVPDASQPFQVTMPAFAHRFATGHQIKLIVAGGSTNYRGGLTPTPVTIELGSLNQKLTLPTL
ncbi:MAG: CocE/NonD family hydrolase [Aeromicrobium sp.]